MIKNDRVYCLLKGYRCFLVAYTGTLGNLTILLKKSIYIFF